MLHAERNTYLQTTLLVDSYKYGDGEKLKRLYIENLTKSIFLLVQIIQWNRSLESMLEIIYLQLLPASPLVADRSTILKAL